MPPRLLPACTLATLAAVALAAACDPVKAPERTVVERRLYDRKKDATIPFVSPDSRRVAILEKTADGKARLVVDGMPGKGYDAIASTWRQRGTDVGGPGGGPFVFFSDDSSRFAHPARVGDRWLMVVDGKEGPWGGAAWAPVFSESGERCGFRVASGRTNTVVVDGEAMRVEGRLQDPVFSPDGQHVAVASQSTVLVDGRTGGRYDTIRGDDHVVFESAHRLRYRAERGGVVYAVEETIR